MAGDVVLSEAKDLHLTSAGSSVRSVPDGVASCTNCGSTQVRHFCADCGERQPSHHDFSVRGLLMDVFHDMTSIDGRVIRSITALLTKPGLLTREWFEGRRGRYVKPFSLFIMLNVVFFLIQPHTQLLSYKYQHYVYGDNPGARARRTLIVEKRAKAGETPEQFEVRFNSALQDQKKSLLIFSVPVLGLTLLVLYARSRRYLAEHLVFSVHAYAFLLVFMGVFVPIVFLGVFGALYAVGVPQESLAFLEGDAGISLLLAVVMGTYLYQALRRVYGDSRVAAVLRSAVLFLVIGKLTNVYHDVLFYTTLYSL